MNPYAPASGIEQRPGWSWLDEYLWCSCDIIADLAEGRLEQRPLVATVARLEAGERVLAVGPAQRVTWRALGDGRYMHQNAVAFGSPAFVLGSMASMATSALGNSARRRAAANDAQPRCGARTPGLHVLDVLDVHGTMLRWSMHLGTSSTRRPSSALRALLELVDLHVIAL
ncbi:hypothetical protein AQJ43_30155 [Streptomyces avermitilis]|uniref:Uncharacterized protein n=2 Tax=Streptomyces avermitilis TaxID=33903 RepID=Q82QQ0_STRAW|nr:MULTISPECIES: hypothetical protein [Streptomyces]KUN50982.1 hypothetical protein AQJ43_30155 [Streptomyces avermitilis]OOV21678.1 hypothetical protein SM007_33355 [Streptomyces avermitilis]BAC68165.1 hypothetical protein SAVERM_455 [Streptomyces avermitilis MA-4680 = NBRC 14893]BBJ47963.1 hypothetical protein SAVMC3_05920 [Streptomyces avermitilis]GDY69673.1 hypothetical protein SAV14893_090660 [Streptomyces avermitilis]